MKRIKLIGLSLLLIICGTLLFTGLIGHLISAVSNKSEVSVENISTELFDGIKIKSAEYLYNYDGSPDYIYVNFENYGYAVYLKETGALLEYSPDGSLSYQNTKTKKYYGGPGNCFIKSGEEFINIDTNESFVISASDAKNYSSQIRNAFKTEQPKKISDINEEQNAGFEMQSISYNAPMSGGSSYDP